MFKIKEYKTVVKKEKLYISFPDVIQSKKNKKTFFMAYRSSGQGHHPLVSDLHFLISEDKCQTWNEQFRCELSLEQHGMVWNCPRLSYIGDVLNIVCDTKSGTNELVAKFKILIIKSYNHGKSFLSPYETEMTGMVPDHVIEFKRNLYCASHIRDNAHKTLTQLVSCSKDKGLTWFDHSIIARSRFNAFCEGSIINYKNKYLMCYLRDNIRGPRHIYKYMSYDGINWDKKGKLSVYGHRPTALLCKEKDRLFISYRNTKDVGVSLLSCNLTNKGQETNIEVINIDEEIEENKFHCGYTGFTRIDANNYYLTYYIKKGAKNPYIKGCFLEWVED
jgi:hypothetical protein